ncbi:protein FAM50 [Apis mellifera caucasica]|uniref:Protein FAM50 homolog n=1 Tax=Apis mellifera TaxID=7460 RepID=A0A7M7GWR0_APIME|nr:protein FAM50 homolog [Apis mellifera]KAG6800997.1 protein FAM50 [Apis mellifera caucasica]KAG9433823.1 protein FAM50 [Apis mellifera carnica]|eukprot:XP_006564855.1 protein FAM50 homolog [Apis mellifera]
MAHYKGAASEAGRAMQLMKKREIAQQEIELRKKKIEDDLKIHNIENKFATHYNAVEQQLKTSTIGLVTLNEMKAKQENIVKERERKLAQKEREKEQEKERALAAKQAEKNKQKKQIQALSFNLYEDEIEFLEGETEKSEILKDNDIGPIIKKIKKNPDVDTSFLPDREREEEENRLREELRQEWARKQNALKEEEIEITFSYWDGSGHRRSVIMKKGNSIYQLLQRCLEVLRREFSELKTIMADQLMYVKEDLILPHHYTFYDFIVTKARGKSGPLFTFDVHDDIRVMHDASVETEESHAGKVLLRSWYERNKHIFPASRWEPFDPTKSYDKYTVSDKNRKKDKI